MTLIKVATLTEAIEALETMSANPAAPLPSCS